MSSIPVPKFTQDSLELDHIKIEPEWSVENDTENQKWEHVDEMDQIKEEVEIHEEKCIVNYNPEWSTETKELELLNEEYHIKEEVEVGDEEFNVLDYDYEFNKECNLEDSKSESQEWESLDEKYHTEEEDKSIVDHDNDGKLFNKQSNLEHEKLKNDSNATNITYPETSEMVIPFETSVLPWSTYKCTHCSYVAKYPSRVKEHFDQVHSEIRNFSCSYCSYAAKKKSALKKHLLRHHTAKPELKSTRCEVATENKTSIASNKLSTCTLCSYTAKASLVKRHFTQKHSEIRSFCCPHCDLCSKAKPYFNKTYTT